MNEPPVVPSRRSVNVVWPVVVLVLLVPLLALALRVEGRLFLCACGVFEVWVGDTCSSSNSQQLFDPYSFTHVLHGVLLFWLVSLVAKNLSSTWQLTLASILEALWEILENTDFIIDRYRAQTAALGYTGDTVVNSIGDLFCAVVGFLIARRVGWARSLIVFLLFELVLLFWIRDSLLLQILMLVYPVNGIKLWQVCQ